MKGKSKLKRINISRRDLRGIFSMTGFNENFENKSKENKMRAFSKMTV